MGWQNVKITDMFEKLTKKVGIGVPDTEAMLTSFASYTNKIAKDLNTIIGGYEKMVELSESAINKTQETADKVNTTLTDLLDDLTGIGMKVINPAPVVGSNKTYYNKLAELIDNEADPNRPNYKDDDYVGCILVLAGAPYWGAPRTLIEKIQNLQGGWPG